MKIPKIGMRIIRTMIAVFLSISIYLIILCIDLARGKELGNVDDNTALYNMYTPFFAGIAAAYALHRDRKSSFAQAKIRSFGSIIGGYFGMIIVLIIEFILIDKLNLKETNYVLYMLINYVVVSLGIIPLITIAVMVKQSSAVFISCLTYLSVTISIRNGGMPVILFATNRVLSTLIGIGIALFINNIGFRYRNKKVLFVSSLDNNFLNKGNMSPYIKYKLNNLYNRDMPLVLATTRTMSTLEYILKDVEVKYPMVVMNGAGIYHYNNSTYENIHIIDQKAEDIIEKELKLNNMNAFRYIVDDNMLHCYFMKLENEGESHFYNQGRKNNFDNFVRAKILDDLDISFYIIIDTKDKVDMLCNKLKEQNCEDYIDLITYKYEECEGDYWYLKINSKESRKENVINSIKENNNFKKVIVCGSGNTDIENIKKADLSICLDTAPNYIRDIVDIVVTGPDILLKIYERIYHSKNEEKVILKIKEKYKKAN